MKETDPVVKLLAHEMEWIKDVTVTQRQQPTTQDGAIVTIDGVELWIGATYVLKDRPEETLVLRCINGCLDLEGEWSYYGIYPKEHIMPLSGYHPAGSVILARIGPATGECNYAHKNVGHVRDLGRVDPKPAE